MNLEEDPWENLSTIRKEMAQAHLEMITMMMEKSIDLAETNALTLGLELP